MAQGRQRDQWHHTAAILALTHNVHAKTPKRPEAFHPMLGPSKRGIPLRASNIRMLKCLLPTSSRVVRPQARTPVAQPE